MEPDPRVICHISDLNEARAILTDSRTLHRYGTLYSRGDETFQLLPSHVQAVQQQCQAELLHWASGV